MNKLQFSQFSRISFSQEVIAALAALKGPVKAKALGLLKRLDTRGAKDVMGPEVRETCGTLEAQIDSQCLEFVFEKLSDSTYHVFMLHVMINQPTI